MSHKSGSRKSRGKGVTPVSVDRYVGKTSKSLRARLKECTARGPRFTAVGEHRVNESQNITVKEATVLPREDNFLHRKISEATEIRESHLATTNTILRCILSANYILVRYIIC